MTDTTPYAAGGFVAARPTQHAAYETIRADAAEREVARSRRILARLLEMAAAWEEMVEGRDDPRLRADFLAEAVRQTIRGDTR